MKKEVISLALVLPFIMASCTNSDSDETTFQSQKISVKADVTDINEPKNSTRSTDVNTFDTGDVIYVGKLSHSDNSRQTSVAYTYNGTEFTGDLTWDYTRETLYAFKRGDDGGNLNNDFTVCSDQSVVIGEAKGLVNSDFLFSAEKENYYSSGTTATLNNFVHRVSKLVVNIACDDDALLTSCNIGGGTFYMTASVANNGVLTAKGKKYGTIQMYHRTGTKTFEAFVIPQTTNSLISDFITFVYDGKTFHFPLSKAITFSGGICHTINITNLTVNGDTPKLHLNDVTTDNIGWVACSDGSVYENFAVAKTLFGYTDTEFIGMIGYVGTGLGCAHGILVAFQDAGTDVDRVYNSPWSGLTVNNNWIAKNTAPTSGSRISLGGWTVFNQAQWQTLMQQCSAAYVNRYGETNALNVTAASNTPVAMWALMSDCAGANWSTALVSGGQHWINQSVPSYGEGKELTWTATYFTTTGWGTCSDRWYRYDYGWDDDDDYWEDWRWSGGNTTQRFAIRAVRTF